MEEWVKGNAGIFFQLCSNLLAYLGNYSVPVGQI
jgi:hypothetical protein